MATPDNTDDQEFYDSLTNAANMDEAMMGLDPGMSVTFPNGTTVRRHDTGWEYDPPPDGPYDPSELTRVYDDDNGHKETTEQAFRRLLGG